MMNFIRKRIRNLLNSQTGKANEIHGSCRSVNGDIKGRK